jgi:hypothetical protein
LVLAVDQPNEVELGNTIKCEIGEKFNLIDTDLVADHIQRKMLDWFKKKGEKGKEGRFLSHEDGEKFFAWAKQKVNTMISIDPSLAYQAEIKKFVIALSNNNLQTVLLNFFLWKNKFSI